MVVPTFCEQKSVKRRDINNEIYKIKTTDKRYFSLGTVMTLKNKFKTCEPCALFSI